jgi:uncharacterized protein
MAGTTTEPTTTTPQAEGEPERLSFVSRGTRCAAWRYRATSDDLATDAGRPCIVLAHGFGGTADSGLEPFARAFAAAGLDALVFDYPGFGHSEGHPRQVVSARGHRTDYAAAVSLARTLGGVDRDRICLFGSSYSGGHVLAVAAADPAIKAVIAQCPAVDGLGALLNVVGYAGPVAPLKLTVAALRDLAGAALRRAPYELPLVGPPGSLAVMTTPDAEPGYTAITGPTWQNRAAAREALLLPLNRPTTQVAKISAPVLYCVCEQDAICPPKDAHKAAAKTPRGEVATYPVGHFDIYEGAWFERAVADQVAFLRRSLQA